MKEIYIKTIKDDILRKTNEMKSGCWINLENPDKNEIEEIAEKLKIQEDWINSSIDIDEKSRIEAENGDILIIVRVPYKNGDGEITTMPVGIIVTTDTLLTVSLSSNFVIEDIKNGKVKIYTTQRARFILKFFERTNYYYDKFIQELEMTSEHIESMLTYSLSNKEIYKLLVIQKALIYFSSAIVSNEIVFEKIRAGKILKLYENDMDLIDDIILSNKEIYEGIKILRDVLSNTLDAYASIISNNLNIVMKFLTSISIILSVPVLIASIYGMNVALPFGNRPDAFMLILLFSFVVSTLIFLFFKRQHWV